MTRVQAAKMAPDFESTTQEGEPLTPADPSGYRRIQKTGTTMKLCAFILLAGCLWGIRATRAQELSPVPFPDADSAAVVLLPSALPPVSVQWLREEVDPILRERRRLHELRERLSQEQVVPAPVEANETETEKATGLWRLNIGNTGVNNRSPFPDRALDARNIIFPMRRDAQADKRSDRQKALDNIRNKK